MLSTALILGSHSGNYAAQTAPRCLEPREYAGQATPTCVNIPGGKVEKNASGCYVNRGDNQYNERVRQLSGLALKVDPGQTHSGAGCVTYPYRGDLYDAAHNSVHAGIDLRADGIDVYAIEGGRVVQVHRPPQHSTLIIENESRDRKILYLHMKEIEEDLTPGKTVIKGIRIGKAGSVGAPFPHLHIEVWPKRSDQYGGSWAISGGSACGGTCYDAEIVLYTVDPFVVVNGTTAVATSITDPAATSSAAKGSPGSEPASTGRHSVVPAPSESTAAGAFPIASAGTEGSLVLVGEARGPVVATYRGHSARYSNDLYLMLDAAGNPGDDGNAANDRFLFNNHRSAVGSIVNLGVFPSGTELMFRLHVNDTNTDYFTGPASRNPDNQVHARVQANWQTGQTLVSFEDLLNGPFHYNDLTFSFSFLPSPDSYTPTIPIATTTLAIATFPAPAGLVDRISTDVVSFVLGAGQQVSSASRQFLEAAVDALIKDPLPQGFKTLINEAANTFETTLNSSSALAGFMDVRNALSLSERALALAQATSPSLSVVDALGPALSSWRPDSAPEMKNARVGAELVNLGLTAWSGARPERLLMQANLMIWGDILPQQMRKFAVDPPDASYSQLAHALVPATLPVTNAGSPLANEYLTRLNRTTLKAAGLLEAVNTSYDRYTAAYAAGDSVNAILQLSAWLYYLAEFRNTLREAANLFGQAAAVMESSGFSLGAPDAALFASSQNELRTRGLPPQLRAFLLDLGFDESRLARIVGDVASAKLAPSIPDLGHTFARVSAALLKAANGDPSSRAIDRLSTSLPITAVVLLLVLVTTVSAFILVRAQSHRVTSK
jgi:hypothetical protein